MKFEANSKVSKFKNGGKLSPDAFEDDMVKYREEGGSVNDLYDEPMDMEFGVGDDPMGDEFVDEDPLADVGTGDPVEEAIKAAEQAIQNGDSDLALQACEMVIEAIGGLGEDGSETDDMGFDDPLMDDFGMEGDLGIEEDLSDLGGDVPMFRAGGSLAARRRFNY